MFISSMQKKLDKKFSGKVHIKDCNKFFRLTGCVDTWEEYVSAGLAVAHPGSKKHIVNDIDISNSQIKEEYLKKPRIPSFSDSILDNDKPDVLIIGSGVVGCAIARELSKWNLNILLIDKEYDVAIQASSRNDGMVHPGIDIVPGMLKKKLNNIGNRMYDKVCNELNIHFVRSGQYLCFDNAALMFPLFLSKLYWTLTGAGKTKILSRKQLLKKEPGVSSDVKCAMFFERAGQICPYGLTIAYAENAISNGVRLSLNTAVLGMNVCDGQIKSVSTNRGVIYPGLVINAAGVFSDYIAELADDKFFSIHPRKGTNIILDKEARKNVNTIYSFMGTQSKRGHTKGGGIVGTVDGNVLVGPDAVETPSREDFSTTANSVNTTIERQKHAGPWLSFKDVITYFTGVRAATYEEDFIVEKGRSTENIIHAAGIQSPGLTAAPAIAVRIEKIAIKYLNKKAKVQKNLSFNPIRKAIVKPSEMSITDRDLLIKMNPNYGEIVCRCEEISKGEIIDAIHSKVPCYSVDAIKRRVRPGMGRCQGGFCGPLVVKILSDELGIEMSSVTKASIGSEILVGEKKYGANDD